MVYSKSHNWILDFLGGHNGMEIAIVLLLIVPLTAATPLRPTPRSDTDTVLPGGTVQASEVERSEVHTAGAACSNTEDHPISFRRQTSRTGCTETQHCSEVTSAPCSSARVPARDMPASQPGQQLIQHQQDKRERGVEKGP
ncbi:hypothetical protein E3U43_012330 [Larimichthys crocea]|uniref:Uncharacterized protein n=1 Tax=Larimichthys crocea TaxID=215358 RepID=A0ACD3RRI7_LARCR|nr:hypothetical protein E3U43_012330 [Larimichthys crocea]